MKKILLIFLLFAGISYGQEPYMKPMLGKQINWGHSLSKSLVGCWLMNEGGGNTVQDLSGNGNDGTLSSGVSWVSTGYGAAIDNSLSSADYITVPHSSSLIGMSALTIVVMAKNNKAAIGGTGYEYMVLKGAGITSGNYVFAWSQDEDIYFSLPDTSGGDKHCASINALEDSDWHHWVGRWDGAEMSIWKDSIKRPETTAFSGTLSAGTGTLKIGGNGIDDSWDGQIAYVYIYNRGLSASEIAQLYREPFCFVGRQRELRRRNIVPVDVAGGAPPVGNAMPMAMDHYRRRRVA